MTLRVGTMMQTTDVSGVTPRELRYHGRRREASKALRFVCLSLA